MTHQQMWEAYSRMKNPEGSYTAWSFGDAPDILAQLVLDGVKTGTASLHHWYEDGSEAMPKAGDYSVILNTREEAVCIIRTTRVYTVPFDAVTEKHAFLEGEGDRSLAYWRRVHETFFTKELQEVGRPFHSRMQVVCEEFEKVFP